MKLSLKCMVLFVAFFTAFEAFSHPGRFAPDAESSSVIKRAPPQTSHPDIDELPLDLSMKSQSRHASTDTPITHKQIFQRLQKFLVQKQSTKRPINGSRKSSPKTRKPYFKQAINLYDLGRSHATLLVASQKQGIPVAPLQEKIKQFYQVTLAR
ncbi:MAG: hypothetical protein ACRCYZ_00385 [Alphaproteobacteria bacterium]